MIDEGLETSPGLTAAEAAVNYLLQRIQVDADLRWIMVGTEAYARLCVAEHERTGTPLETIRTAYATPPERLRGEKPKLIRYRTLVDEIEKLARDGAIAYRSPLEMCERISRLIQERP
jgi:hypothetical protein